ncbi:MAG: hypothetical protein OQK24_12205 [Magnetovibrio sp.]|nr:hypothetical protein [Magnetovibrio sp.]
MPRIKYPPFVIAAMILAGLLTNTLQSKESTDYDNLGLTLGECSAVFDHVEAMQKNENHDFVRHCISALDKLIDAGGRIGWVAIIDYIPQIKRSNDLIEYDVARFYFVRGILYSLLKEYNNALKDVQKSHDLQPQNTTFLRERARVFYRLKRNKEAVDDIETLKAKDPSFRCWYKECGLAYFINDDYENTIIGLGPYLERIQDDADAFYIRGVAHKKLGNLKEAASDIEAYLKLKPSDTETQQWLEEIRTEME